MIYSSIIMNERRYNILYSHKGEENNWRKIINTHEKFVIIIKYNNIKKI